MIFSCWTKFDMKYFRGMILLFLFGLVFSCEAPRLNPLDPQNPDSNIGQIDGYVYSRPHDPLPNAKITLKWQNISIETDAQGYYKFDNIEIVDGIVYFEKQGLKKDSIRVLWNRQKSIRLEEKTLDYSMGQIDGTVKAAAPSSKSLSGVKVFWKNQNVQLATDSQGNFNFSNISYSNGWMFFEIDGYSKDSLFIDFSGYVEKVKHLNIIYLNSIPKLNDLKIFTSVLNRYPDVQNDSLFIKANISDAENDVDSVFVQCTELNINKKLPLNSASGYYENKFSPGDLNLNFLDEGIGKDFKIIVKDKSKKNFNVGFSTIKRVIRKDIIFRSPANLEIVKKPTKFIWERFLPGFNFKYMFEIYKNTFPPMLVKQWVDISKEEVEFTPTIDLPPGEYVWVIWAVDDFQNRARSLYASFVVQ